MIHIHVAEDNNLSYFLIEKMLTKSDFIVSRSRNGLEAVEFARKADEDAIILMDLMMPEMDGYQALQEIRKFNTTIPVIIQSACCMPEDVEKAMEMGCTDYITKPVNREKLIDVILKYSFEELQHI